MFEGTLLTAAQMIGRMPTGSERSVRVAVLEEVVDDQLTCVLASELCTCSIGTAGENSAGKRNIISTEAGALCQKQLTSIDRYYLCGSRLLRGWVLS